MPRKGSGWLIGCGAGCGVLLFIAMAVLISGLMFFRDTAREVNIAEGFTEELETRYGTIEDFTPHLDGHVPPERMRRFLEVRSSLLIHQQRLTVTLGHIIPDQAKRREGGFWTAMKIIRRLGNLIPEIVMYIQLRNKALLDAEMGLGEYLYIYTLAYHSWLGNAPGDGPEIEENGRKERLLDGDDGTFSREKTLRRYNRYMLAILRNQRDIAVSERKDASLVATIQAEITAMEKDYRRTLWQSGPSPAIIASLEPFKTELEKTYSPGANCFEWGPDREEKWKMD